MRQNAYINKLPLSAARYLVRAQQVINSNTSAMRIEHKTGVHHSTIYRLRHHERSMKSVTLVTCWKLANYPLEKPLNYNKLNRIFQELLNSYHDISALSRATNISRITIQRLSKNENNLKKMNILTVIKLLQKWQAMKYQSKTNLGKVVKQHKAATHAQL